MKKTMLAALAVILFATVNSASAISEIPAVQPEQPETAVISKKKFWQRKVKIETEDNVLLAADLRGGVETTPEDTIELQVTEEAEPKTPLQGWLEGDYMSGDWGGWRTKLEDHGVTFEAMMLSDTFMKLHGGTQKSRYPVRNFGLIDAAIHLDTEKLGLWKNGEFVLRYQFLRGTGLNRHLGAYQYVDAFDVDHMNQLAEYWYEQGFFDNKIQIKVGKQDACYDFLALDLATNFVNNSHAYFMPNVPLPAYPDQALGLVLKINPTEWLSLRTGWYDGNARGSQTGFNTVFGGHNASFLIQEIGIRHNKWDMPGTILAGGWIHTGQVDSLSIDGEIKAQTMGAYIEAEQMVWKENKDNAEDNQGLYALVQYSFAPSNRSEISHYYGNTLMYKGLISGRDEDVAGVGVALAQFSDKLRNIVDDGRRGLETIVEAFYKFQLTPWFSIQPVAQYIFRPDGQSSANSFVLGFRTVVTF